MELIFFFVETTFTIITVTVKMKTIFCLEIRSLMSFVYQQKGKVVMFAQQLEHSPFSNMWPGFKSCLLSVPAGNPSFEIPAFLQNLSC